MPVAREEIMDDRDFPEDILWDRVIRNLRKQGMTPREIARARVTVKAGRTATTMPAQADRVAARIALLQNPRMRRGIMNGTTKIVEGKLTLLHHRGDAIQFQLVQ